MQLLGVCTIGVKAQVNNDEVEGKISCSATLEDNFADNRVLVTLRTEVSKELKSLWSKEDFSEVSCVSVKSLTDNNGKATKQQEFEKTVNNSGVTDFKTTLLLELPEKSKANVLDTIKKLEKREDVLYVEPDYSMTFFGVPTPTYYTSQWPLNNSNPNNPLLRMHDTWDITQGNKAVKVAIMDSGIQADHCDLMGKVDTVIRSDNGPEFIATELRKWFEDIGVNTTYITPGSPWGNGYCESLNSKMRDEFLNLEIFSTLNEAKALTKNWILYYNTIRPHSSLNYQPPAPLTIQAF